MNSEEAPDEVIAIALKIIDLSKDTAIKYDACQFLAYAYKAKGEFESARKAIDLIPDIRFSNQRLKACILQGEEKWNATCQEFNESLYALMFITYKMAECYSERGEYPQALECYENALRVLDLYNVKDSWYGFRKGFHKEITKMKKAAESPLITDS